MKENQEQQEGTPLFTLIISACNIEQYVPQAAQSIKKQTFENFEAIVIIEESKDRTEIVCRKEFGDDPRFKLFCRPCSNAVSTGRNFGLENARGEYVLYLDGDDWLETDALKQFSDAIEEYGRPDIISGGCKFRLDEDSDSPEPEQMHVIERYHDQLPPQKIYNGRDALIYMLPRCIYLMVWLRIYRREFLISHSLFQIPGRIHEDDEWTPRVIFEAERIVALPYLHYNYRRRKTASITNSGSRRSLTCRIDNCLSFIDFWNSNDIPDRLKRPLSSFYADYLLRFFWEQKMQLYTYEERFRELHRLHEKENAVRDICRIANHAGYSKRMLIPCLFLSRRKTGFILSSLYMKKIHYPLLITVWGKFLKPRLAGRRR